MAEPLKDKKVASFDAEYCKEGSFFKDKDIKSAVEWLKKGLKNKVIWKSGYNEQVVDELIDQAFPDTNPNKN